MSAVTPKLNHYLTERPQDNANCNWYKWLATSALEKICWIAFIAIVGVTLSLSYAGVALVGAEATALVASIISTPFIYMAATKLRACSLEYYKAYELEQGVADELKSISDWTEDAVETFFADANLTLPEGVAPCDLLPLIARTLHWIKLTEKASKAVFELLTQEIDDRQVRLQTRRIAWQKIEFELFPRLFQSALYLELLQRPTLELSLSDFGQFKCKTFEERMFDRKYDKDDTYFEFYPRLKKDDITFNDLYNSTGTKALHKVLVSGLSFE